MNKFDSMGNQDIKENFKTSLRINSIDIFRAITMFLMIFVNDLWTLEGMPKWLLHAEANEDYLGFSDIIFPSFLFIVGLSIPLAIQARQIKGETDKNTFFHVISRAASLLIMGFFHVNLSSYNDSLALLPKPVWQILITVSFFLIWLDYRHLKNRNQEYTLRITGLLLLIALAVLYKGGEIGNPQWMQPQWWGILGLIGWAYLFAAMAYLFIGGRLAVHLTLFILLFIYNISLHAGWFNSIMTMISQVDLIGNGSEAALVMAGMISTLWYQRHLKQKISYPQYITGLAVAALILGLVGLLLRPYWGISKISATPSWISICLAINLIILFVFTFLIDKKSQKHIFKVIKPAGTSTLTCYLLPYIHYALLSLTALTLPLILRTGILGIFKSLLYALIIIVITGLLEKFRIRLKI